jgi:hypothetical protein
MFLEEGYKVFVIDRPGQGRNPHHPWVHGQYDAQAPTFDRVAQAIGATAAAHTQWPGTGATDDPAIAQVAAAMGQPMANNEITRPCGDRVARCCSMTSAPQCSSRTATERRSHGSPLRRDPRS